MPATKILVLGRSGTGKSTAWRNVPASESVVITPNDKPLPFKGGSKLYSKAKGNLVFTDQITELPGALKYISDSMPHIKYVLIDDYTHYQSARTLSDAFNANAGFQKWGVFGKDMKQSVAKGGGLEAGLRDDLFIVYNSHVQIDGEQQVVMRTAGKLLENQVDLPSYFTYIYHTEVLRTDSGVGYKFLTQNDGAKSAKSPMGLHEELYVDNDLFAIMQQIKAYQEEEVEEPA